MFEISPRTRANAGSALRRNESVPDAEKPKNRNEFDENVWKNCWKKERHTHLVCKACQNAGYSPCRDNGLQSFSCVGGLVCGHLDFEYTLFKNFLKGKTSAKKLICEKCKIKPQYVCCIGACPSKKKSQYEWKFQEISLRSAKHNDLQHLSQQWLHQQEGWRQGLQVRNVQTHVGTGKNRKQSRRNTNPVCLGCNA